ELCGDAPLLELVTVRQLRRKRRYRDGDTLVELSLDEVEVIARARLVERFIELEVELVSGPEEPLLALRDVLDANPALVPSTTSKFEAALAAIRRRPADDRRRSDDRARRDGVRNARPARAQAASEATTSAEAPVAEKPAA